MERVPPAGTKRYGTKQREVVGDEPAGGSTGKDPVGKEKQTHENSQSKTLFILEDLQIIPKIITCTGTVFVNERDLQWYLLLISMNKEEGKLYHPVSYKHSFQQTVQNVQTVSKRQIESHRIRLVSPCLVGHCLEPSLRCAFGPFGLAWLSQVVRNLVLVGHLWAVYGSCWSEP